MITPPPLFLPTPSARRATHYRGAGHYCVAISTHALREEGDRHRCLSQEPPGRFLPTPSARRATALRQVAAAYTEFLPTPSARRATELPFTVMSGLEEFLPTPSARRATHVDTRANKSR